MRNFIVSAIILSLGACSGNSFSDIQGTLKSTTASINIPAKPTPTILVTGHDPNEFEVDYVTSTLGTSAVASFVIKNVPTKQPLVFQVSHPTAFDTIISFPFDLSINKSIILPALEQGTTSTIVNAIEALTMGSVDLVSHGIILGQLVSEGTAVVGACPSSSVELTNKDTGATISVTGPYYFNSSGQVVQATSFQDSQCSYVLANVIPGDYNLLFVGGQQAKTQEVVVISGNVSFGIDVPQ